MVSNLFFLIPDTLDGMPFGATVRDGQTFFKVFSSIAQEIELHLFKEYDGRTEQIIPLQHFGDGIWGIQVNKALWHWLYAYKVICRDFSPPQVQLTDELIADPWSKHIVSKNHYLQLPRTYILPDSSFDWQGDTFVTPKEINDLIIYETHLKDITASPSTWSFTKGSYKSFIDPCSRGGLNHIKRLGVNAVEFLPLQKFAHIEPSYLQAFFDEAVNSWNYYGRNYFGYMTSFYFCPETSYASTANSQLYETIGSDFKAQTELKEIVRALHQNQISVILDVVYNHVSNYDLNPLKFLDKSQYFRLDANDRYRSDSGCGNDLKTESPQSRQLIIESLKYWMTEFHIDGFRFDLASLIDWETIDEIKKELSKVNPDVILIAEAWSPVNYAPSEFGTRGWAAWNDRFRNGIKGAEPIHRLGYIFGHQNEFSNKGSVQNYLQGTLVNYPNGLFPDSSKSINYLESHDGYTLADFIRLSVNPDKATKPVRNKKEFTRLNDTELHLSKFAAFILFVSQGAVMIHNGQEFGRSKIIAENIINDPRTGFIDHDSYNKDNETNYLDFNEIELNSELIQYYKALIQLRKKHPILRKAKKEQIHFIETNNDLITACYIKGEVDGQAYEYQIWLNAQPRKNVQLQFDKDFIILADSVTGYYKKEEKIRDYQLSPSSGIVLIQYLHGIL